MFHPSLLRGFRTNDRNFHYCCLMHTVVLDMMFTSTLSRMGNRCVQVYATDFGWVRAFPMISRSESHETRHDIDQTKWFTRNKKPQICDIN